MVCEELPERPRPSERRGDAEAHARAGREFRPILRAGCARHGRVENALDAAGNGSSAAIEAMAAGAGGEGVAGIEAESGSSAPFR